MSTTMHLEPDSPRRTNEQRRYFPDWTRHRLLEVCEELEADHNSFLAGGYAEEFGYRAQTGFSRGVPVLDGEPPEQSAEWLGQAAAMHPGYPIRPHPIALDRDPAGGGFAAAAGWELVVTSHGRFLETTREVERHGTFVRVTDRAYEHERHHAAQRAAAALTRFLAGLVALRWELPRRRRAP